MRGRRVGVGGGGGGNVWGGGGVGKKRVRGGGGGGGRKEGGGGNGEQFSTGVFSFFSFVFGVLFFWKLCFFY